VASAASVSAERRRAARHAAAHRRVSQTCLSVRTWLDNALFGAPLPCFLRVILSENRTPLFGVMRWRRIFVVRSWEWLGKTRTQKMRRENELYFVIAGLDSAIHAGATLGKDSPSFACWTSAWTTGSSLQPGRPLRAGPGCPVVTKKGFPRPVCRERSICGANGSSSVWSCRFRFPELSGEQLCA
jgi:hypothetical protein